MSSSSPRVPVSTAPPRSVVADDSNLAPAAATTEARRAVVSPHTILRMIRCISDQASHNVPIDDLSSFQVDDMRLSLSKPSEDVPRVVPFLDLAMFETLMKGTPCNWIMTRAPALPACMTQDEKPPHPALCWGVLFHGAYKEFSYQSHSFFDLHFGSIRQQNPDIRRQSHSQVPECISIDDGYDSWTEGLKEGERDETEEVVWMAWSGLSHEELQGVIISSRASDHLMAKQGFSAVTKAEILVLLAQLGRQAHRSELIAKWYPEWDLPTVMVMNFMDKYAHIVQGALVRPDHDPGIVELRLSVSENLRYLDDKDELIPGAWKQMLHWTFCRAVGAKGGHAATGYAPSAAPKQQDAKLVVPKVRGEKTDDFQESSDDIVLRLASRSTAVSSSLSD